jgi:hypothetical protein
MESCMFLEVKICGARTKTKVMPDTVATLSCVSKRLANGVAEALQPKLFTRGHKVEDPWWQCNYLQTSGKGCVLRRFREFFSN